MVTRLCINIFRNILKPILIIKHGANSLCTLSSVDTGGIHCPSFEIRRDSSKLRCCPRAQSMCTANNVLATRETMIRPGDKPSLPAAVLPQENARGGKEIEIWSNVAYIARPPLPAPPCPALPRPAPPCPPLPS